MRLPRTGWLVALPAALGAIAALAHHWILGGLSCSQDTSDCTDVATAGRRWFEAYDFSTTWQYRSVLALGFLGLAMLIATPMLPSSIRDRVRAVGALTCLACVAMWVLVWSVL